PILSPAIYGLYITFTAKNNAVSYVYFRNWMFVFQRISGIVTLIFISWHVWETRIQALLCKEVIYDMMSDILNYPFMFGFYLVGVFSTIFHFAIGLWTFCIS
ncbi:succinate dehydrogenase, partial [Bacillus mycoides]|nr:succinate dehydrogenase [Bacillus mycoides]